MRDTSRQVARSKNVLIFYGVHCIFEMTFFRDGQDFQCSLGLIFALELNETDLKPNAVFAVVPGSPASLAGSVLPGDEVRLIYAAAPAVNKTCLVV